MGRNSGTQARRLPRYAPWAVPVAVVTAAGLVIAGSVLASAQAAPVLPHRTAASLLADAIAARPPSALSGSVTEDASLGLPQLPQSDFGGGVPGYSLLAGSHSFSFWSDGPGRLRIAVPVQLGETDLRVDGSQAWLWNSSTNTATHIVPPAGAAPLQADLSGTAPASGWTGAMPLPAGSQSSAQQASGGVPQALAGAGTTPLQAARRLLAAVGPTSTVSVQSNVMVAGQAAYQIALAPKASGSLIGQIRIAIDARGYLPLRLQVFARGAASPAYQVGYTSLSFGRPAASNFSFTPPPGAKVKTLTVPRLGPGLLGGLGLPSGLPAAGAQPIIAGRCSTAQKWAAVNGAGLNSNGYGPKAKMLPLILHCLSGPVHLRVNPRNGDVKVLPALPRKFIRRLLPALRHGSPAQRAAAMRKLRQALQAQIAAHPANGGGWINVRTPSPAAGPQVIGTGWLAVLVLPEAGAVDPMVGASASAAPVAPAAPAPPAPAAPPAGPMAQLLPGPHAVKGHMVVRGSASSASSASSAPPAPPGSSGTSAASSAAVSATPADSSIVTVTTPAAPLPPLLRLLLRAAQPVHGAWGSGRLIRTSLLSVLLTSSGRVLIGAVTPAVLYAAAAKAK